jgi:predicted MFS family arabinose efflux permease
MRNSKNKFPFGTVLSRYSEARKWMSSPVSRQSRYALDCLNFLVGSVQIGLGTFVAFYLASLGWSKESVGLALASGQIAGVLGQIPGGAVTDAITWKRGFAALGIMMSMGAALIFAAVPQFAFVFVAEILDGLTAAIVPLAIAAISLGLVGRHAMSSRTGRNYRFAAAGIVVAAVAQGLIGSYFAKNAIFFATAAVCVLALLALRFINPDEIDYCRARNAAPGEGAKPQTLRYLVRNRTLFYFVLCLLLFQFADASVFPLITQNIGTSKAESSSLQITGLIVTAQLVVMLLAPWVGYLSEGYGRKPLLLLGFGLESIRSVLFSATTDYGFLLVGQLLGGVTSAIVEVLIIVIITDLTVGTGRFNLVGGAVTMLMGAASAISVAASGFIFHEVGHLLTFMFFAGIAAMATAFTWFSLAETRPARYGD